MSRLKKVKKKKNSFFFYFTTMFALNMFRKKCFGLLK